MPLDCWPWRLAEVQAPRAAVTEAVVAGHVAEARDTAREYLHWLLTRLLFAAELGRATRAASAAAGEVAAAAEEDVVRLAWLRAEAAERDVLKERLEAAAQVAEACREECAEGRRGALLRRVDRAEQRAQLLEGCLVEAKAAAEQTAEQLGELHRRELRAIRCELEDRLAAAQARTRHVEERTAAYGRRHLLASPRTLSPESRIPAAAGSPESRSNPRLGGGSPRTGHGANERPDLVHTTSTTDARDSQNAFAGRPPAGSSPRTPSTGVTTRHTVQAAVARAASLSDVTGIETTVAGDAYVGSRVSPQCSWGVTTHHAMRELATPVALASLDDCVRTSPSAMSDSDVGDTLCRAPSSPNAPRAGLRTTDTQTTSMVSEDRSLRQCLADSERHATEAEELRQRLRTAEIKRESAEAQASLLRRRMAANRQAAEQAAKKQLDAAELERDELISHLASYESRCYGFQAELHAIDSFKAEIVAVKMESRGLELGLAAETAAVSRAEQELAEVRRHVDGQAEIDQLGRMSWKLVSADARLSDSDSELQLRSLQQASGHEGMSASTSSGWCSSPHEVCSEDTPSRSLEQPGQAAYLLQEKMELRAELVVAENMVSKQQLSFEKEWDHLSTRMAEVDEAHRKAEEQNEHLQNKVKERSEDCRSLQDALRLTTEELERRDGQLAKAEADAAHLAKELTMAEADNTHVANELKCLRLLPPKAIQPPLSEPCDSALPGAVAVEAAFEAAAWCSSASRLGKTRSFRDAAGAMIAGIRSVEAQTLIPAPRSSSARGPGTPSSSSPASSRTPSTPKSHTGIAAPSPARSHRPHPGRPPSRESSTSPRGAVPSTTWHGISPKRQAATARVRQPALGAPPPRAGVAALGTASAAAAFGVPRSPLPRARSSGSLGTSPPPPHVARVVRSTTGGGPQSPSLRAAATAARTPGSSGQSSPVTGR